MSQTLHRSRRFGVGKEMGGAVYVHKSALDALPAEPLGRASAIVPEGFVFDVVKYDARKGVISFIRTDDFDGLPEPAILEVCTIDPSGSVTHRRYSRSPIYHHKWLFVRPDYEGFDVEASQRRSAVWESWAWVDRRRIGQREYWESQVLPKIDELIHG